MFERRLWTASNNTPRYSGEMSSGRPRVTSRATIAEAATELFLERGFADTTVADITQRAGVSRSSFFNYFTSKSAILWAGLDEGIEVTVGALRRGTPVSTALRAIASGIDLDALALGILHSTAMGISGELAEERAIRTGVLARAVADHYIADGSARLAAEVRAAGHAGAVLAAIWAWAASGPVRPPLAAVLDDALALAAIDR